GHLPLQRRILGLDPCPTGLRAVDVDTQHDSRQRLVEAEVERVSRLWRRAEGQLVTALRPRDPAGNANILDVAVSLYGVGDRVRRRDDEILGCLEDDRFLTGRAHGPHFSDAALDQEWLLGWCGEAKTDV